MELKPTNLEVSRNTMDITDAIIFKLQNLENKISIEKLVYKSLLHEELTDEFLNKFIDTLENICTDNIDLVKSIIKDVQKMESK